MENIFKIHYESMHKISLLFKSLIIQSFPSPAPAIGDFKKFQTCSKPKSMIN